MANLWRVFDLLRSSSSGRIHATKEQCKNFRISYPTYAHKIAKYTSKTILFLGEFTIDVEDWNAGNDCRMEPGINRKVLLMKPS